MMLSILSANLDVAALPEIDAEAAPVAAAVAAAAKVDTDSAGIAGGSAGVGDFSEGVNDRSSGAVGRTPGAAPASAAGRKGPKLSADGFGSRIAPPTDIRGDNQRFERFRDQLLHQYGGETLDRLATIDSMALLMVQATRLHRFMEGCWRPSVPADVERRARGATDDWRQRGVLFRLISRCDTRRPMDCSAQEIEVVAPRLADALQGLIDIVADADEENAAIRGKLQSLLPMPDIEAEQAEAREELASFAPVKEIVLDRARARAVLRGEVVLTEAQFDLVKRLLQMAIGAITHQWNMAQNDVLECRRAEGASTRNVIDNPRRLNQVISTIDKIERAIQQRRGWLEKN